MKKLLLFLSFVCFTIVANAQCTVLFNFDTIYGMNPQSSLIYDGTFLYGMAYYGGVSYNPPAPGHGSIFKIRPDGSGFVKLMDFPNDPFPHDSIGSFPWGTLISDGTFMYGMTSGGGTHLDGTIFKIKPDGTNYTKLYNFETLNGVFPVGDLVSDGSFLYGMTTQGGTQNAGVIFKIKTDGSNYVKLMDFDITNGNNPHGSLIYDGTFLYGMAYGGGANYSGRIFKIKPDGSGYESLWDFDSINGKLPLGSLISDGTFLYGVTSFGGTSTDCNNGCGVIFKIKPDGTDYVKLLDFDSTKGSFPVGSLMFDGNYLYGMTNGNGPHNYGTVFKVKPDGSGFEKLLDFNSINGRWPMYGSLISDGSFLYGMTYRGGTYDKGVIFKLPYHCSAQFTLVPDTTTLHHYFIVNNAAGVPPLKFNWSWGDGAHDTIAYPSHTYSAAGNYNICLTVSDSTGCSSTYCTTDSLQKSTNSIIYVDVVPHGTLGINNINNNNTFSVFPNPTTTTLTIQTPQKATSDSYRIEITDIEGQIIKTFKTTSPETTIDVSGLSSGVYIIKAQSDKGIVVRKLIKE